MKSINSTLQDIVITRQHEIENYKKYIENKTKRLYIKGMKKLYTKLLSYADDKNNTIKTRQMEKEILEALLEIQNEIDNEFESTLNTELESFSEEEKDFYNKTMKDLFNEIEVKIPIVVPAKGVLFSKAKKDPMYLDNDTVTTYMEQLVNHKQRSKLLIDNITTKAYNLKTPIYDVASNNFSSDRSNYRSVIRNAAIVATLLAAQTSSTSRDGFFESNKSFTEGYKWVSILDSKTTDICRYRSERVWFFDDPENSTLDGPVKPPAHHSCRSTTVPIIKSADNIKALTNEMIVAGGLAAILNGKPSNEQSYYEWLNGQPERIQEEVLGTTRYTMWKNKEITIDKFYNADSRFYTLKELHELGYEIPKQYIQYIRGS